MPRECDRRLLLALVASLLVHLVLLVGVYPEMPVRMAPAAKPIEAVINPRAQAIPRAAAPPAPALLDASPRPRMTAGGQVSAQRQRPVTAPHVIVPPSLGAAAAPGKAGQEPTLPLVADAPAGAAHAPARDGVGPDDLRQYRLALAIAARRFKRYPAVARENGWEGAIEVAVSKNAWRHAPELSLVRSSGRAILDAQAMLMIEQAVAATTLPESMQGRDFRVSLPIEFSLDPGR